ncbi:MAG TPA: aminotransferase class V-fold PLP-dependent enzyme [Ilumatobacter sp.]|nr:aminotransferase class V-fold PLP-dependent enzyme [Ilumatobacter sp.]
MTSELTVPHHEVNLPDHGVNLAGGPEILAIPGPSIMPDRVLAAMARQMTDIYVGDLVDISDEIGVGLSAVARTTAEPFIGICNGHGAWEMALANTLSRGDKVLVFDCGGFATGWGEMARFNGLDVEIIAAAPARAVDPAVVEAHLRADSSHQVKAVLMVHVDTGTSIRNDIAAMRTAIDAAGHPALFMVDCIASLGCERYEMDEWGVDVTVAASQKGLMTPPGLGFVWPSERALEAHLTANLRTSYWDWTSRQNRSAHYLRYCGTPPVSHLFALREALLMIADEGLENVWARHRVIASAVRAAVGAWVAPDGLELHAKFSREQANSVTSVLTGAVHAADIRRLCQEQMGVTLGIGLRDAAGRSFRIGHMGHVNAPGILGVLSAIDTALDVIDAPRSGSGAAAAAAVMAAAIAGE